MQTNVLDYLEHIVKIYPNKIAYAADDISLTFQEVYQQAKAIGSGIIDKNIYKKPVVVYMKKSPQAIATFFGVAYSGNYYVPMDEDMPLYRVEMIFQTLQPECIICDEYTKETISHLHLSASICLYDELIQTKINQEKIDDIYKSMLDIDPLYIVFTSGSTGVPKGVVACHRSVIDYIENLSLILQINSETIFGNQAPLYFDACLKEIYPTIKFGATTYLIPKQLFMFPVQLVEYLNQYKINTICWVASALSLVSGFQTFQQIQPQYLHTIAFGSEVFPIQQYQQWKAVLPNARFINLYGPTEATGMSCYYEVDGDYELNEVIPIGKPFHNTEILLLKEDDTLADIGEVGEICIRGTAVTMGYYNNPEKTSEVFIQNPLQKNYPEMIYKTGDLAKYNENKDLVFVSRKDYQIKHMGHRIELGEIELQACTLDGITSACCLYDNQKDKIILTYLGNVLPKILKKYLKEKLPRYMLPHKVIQLEQIPYTANGKIDRKLLKQKFIESEG